MLDRDSRIIMWIGETHFQHSPHNLFTISTKGVKLLFLVHIYYIQAPWGARRRDFWRSIHQSFFFEIRYVYMWGAHFLTSWANKLKDIRKKKHYWQMSPLLLWLGLFSRFFLFKMMTGLPKSAARFLLKIVVYIVFPFSHTGFL